MPSSNGKGAKHLFYEKPSFLCSWKLCPEKEKKWFNYKLQIIILLPTGRSTLCLTLKTVSKNRQNDYTKQASEFKSQHFVPCNYEGKNATSTIIRNKCKLMDLNLKQ